MSDKIKLAAVGILTSAQAGADCENLFGVLEELVHHNFPYVIGRETSSPVLEHLRGS